MPYAVATIDPNAEPVDYTVNEETWADHLSEQEQRFVLHWVKCLDIQKAAKAAGYSEATAQTGAYGWVRKNMPTKPWVRAAFDLFIRLRNDEMIVDARMVFDRAKAIAMGDVRKVARWHSARVTETDEDTNSLEDGQTVVIRETVSNTVEIIASDEIDDDTAASIKAIKQDANGNVQIEMHSPAPYLMLLAKMTGAIQPDRLEVSGPGGRPIQAVAVHVDTTPQQAAEAWRAILKAG